MPTRRLADLVPKIRDLVAGRPVDFEGTEVRIRWADEDVPIMMPATGPKNLRVAGALADIVMIYVGVHPVTVRWAIDHVRAGAAKGGPDPDVGRDRALCAMWVSDDQEEAWVPAAGRPPPARTTSRT